MSRIGKAPIKIPEKVTVTVQGAEVQRKATFWIGPVNRHVQRR